MSIFNDKALKGVADAVSKIMDEELKGNQHKIDANNNGKVDAHDFKLLRAKKGMKEEAEKMAKKDHDGDGKIESGKAEYLGSRIRAAKAAGKMKEETELEEAFPTVADGEKSLRAKEGKTSSGTVTKTKTGLVHKRDYKDDETDSDDTQKKSKGYGARQNMGKRGQSDGTKKTMKESKLSFTEMLELYNEAGVEVISKIAPQTVKFGDTEVELIDANEVNGAVAITVAEEVDNETFTKEVEAQKAKNAGGGKKAEVAKASVQAVKQEEVEQIDEISKETAGKYLTAPQGKGANKYKVSADKASYPDIGTMNKHATNVRRALQRSDSSSIYKKPSYYKEETEQLDEISKGTLGSYIKKASHDVASKGAITRHFADKSRRETEEKKHDLAKDSMKRSDKVFASGWKRREGMAKAVDRLTKEETQLDEKLPASASAGDYIHDFVHSDNPKFAGKSTKERQKMALGAFYAKNKGK